MNLRSCSLILSSVLLAVAAFGCKPYAVEETTSIPVTTTTDDGVAAVDPRVVDLKKTAEQKLFPAMKPELIDFVRGQEFFAEVTPAEYTMLETLRDTGRAAEKYGKDADFMSNLHLATEQWWYTDGFDDNEAKALTALFRAYQSSLSDRYIINIGDLMPSSLRGNYFHVLQLPESGEVTIVLAADPEYEALAPEALRLAVDNLPRVESIVGKFPYPFLYIYLTDLGDDGLLGLNRNEFIEINRTAVDVNTISHEMTHATVYGNFPTWFEEGFAYFVGNYAANELAVIERDALAAIAVTRRPRQLDLRAKFDHSAAGYFSTISQGFLFFKGYSDIVGLDAMGQTIRALRGKTYTNDNELLRAIVTNSPPDKQQAVQTYLCGAVVGLRSGC
jgi:hypothetical protein